MIFIKTKADLGRDGIHIPAGTQGGIGLNQSGPFIGFDATQCVRTNDNPVRFDMGFLQEHIDSLAFSTETGETMTKEDVLQKLDMVQRGSVAANKLVDSIFPGAKVQVHTLKPGQTVMQAIDEIANGIFDTENDDETDDDDELEEVPVVLEEVDISSEAYRTYDFTGFVDGGNGISVEYKIDRPVKLMFRKGGTTHRIVDAGGEVHLLPAPGYFGCVIRWKPA